MDKNNLKKLIEFINELSSLKGNEWFKEELYHKLNDNTNLPIFNPQLEEIYELCIRKILQEHATNFYADFKLLEIKGKLIEDYVRMEKFRREDNFQDFSLALFQQIEGIVNFLITKEIQTEIINHQNIDTHKVRNRDTGIYETQKLWQLIFFPKLTSLDLEKKISKSILEWDFLEKYKTILYIFYFNRKIYNYKDFENTLFIGNDLYQSRNLNHRGGIVSDFKKRTIDKVMLNSSKYYFKFLGFLEGFITTINKNI